MMPPSQPKLLTTAYHQRRVTASRPLRIDKHTVDRQGPGHVWNVVQIAERNPLVLIDRRRHVLVLDRQAGGRGLEYASGGERLPNHRLDGRDRDLIGARTECPLEGVRVADIGLW